MSPEIRVVLWLCFWVVALEVVAAVVEAYRERRRLLRGGSAEHAEDYDELVAAGYCEAIEGGLPDFLQATPRHPCGDGAHRHGTEVEAHACTLLRSVWEQEEVGS